MVCFGIWEAQKSKLKTTGCWDNHQCSMARDVTVSTRHKESCIWSNPACGLAGCNTVWVSWCFLQAQLQQQPKHVLSAGPSVCLSCPGTVECLDCLGQSYIPFSLSLMRQFLWVCQCNMLLWHQALYHQPLPSSERLIGIIEWCLALVGWAPLQWDQPSPPPLWAQPSPATPGCPTQSL